MSFRLLRQQHKQIYHAYTRGNRSFIVKYHGNFRKILHNWAKISSHNMWDNLLVNTLADVYYNLKKQNMLDLWSLFRSSWPDSPASVDFLNNL